jgi:hypothetical protein
MTWLFIVTANTIACRRPADEQDMLVLFIVTANTIA